MAQPRVARVLIKEGQYNDKNGLVKLLVHDFDEEKDLTLAFGAGQLAPAFGLNKKLTDDQIRYFLSELEGKKANWELHSDISELDAKSFKEKTENELLQEHSRAFDGYPYRELLEEMQEKTEEGGD